MSCNLILFLQAVFPAHWAAIPSWVHHTLFYLLLLVQLKTLAVEGRVLLANERLMNEIDSAAATLEA